MTAATGRKTIRVSVCPTVFLSFM